METLFITDCSIEDALKLHGDDISNANLVVFGFNGMGLVSYKKELGGETEYFHDLAKLSRQLSCVIVCGCDTDNYGVFRHSAVIADKGKILGVSDMAHSIDDSEYAAGSGLRVYDTSAGKIGLIVAEDLFFPQTSQVLSLCDADFIVCVFKKLESTMPQVMLRANAFANGVTMALCAINYVCVADIKGQISVASGADMVKANIKIEKDYHLIQSRRRGLCREFNSGC